MHFPSTVTILAAMYLLLVFLLCVVGAMAFGISDKQKVQTLGIVTFGACLGVCALAAVFGHFPRP